MAENSKIAWTDSTFNPWIGCTKVSDGCKFCYAEELMDKRYQKVKWGPNGARVRTSPANWKKPIAWNKAHFFQCEGCNWRGELKINEQDDSAEYYCPECGDDAEEVKRRVFCASLADVFEDNPQLVEWRADLMNLILNTPNLNWLVLTKRPENVREMMLYTVYMHNFWLGTTIESQEHAVKRAGYLIEFTAAVHFVSVEPQIGEVSLSRWLGTDRKMYPEHGVDWVIVGGESGKGSRPFDVDWARKLRDECQRSGASFFAKQVGGYPNKRDELQDFPADLRIREFPRP